MQKSLALKCGAIAIPLFFAVVAFAHQIPKRGKKPTKYPLQCAGIKVGDTNDAAVVRLYGEGYFAANEGHLGGRYYVDLQRRVTLHIEIGTDRMIESAELQKGLHLPRTATLAALEKAVTPKLKSQAAIQGGFGLGASAQKIIQYWGKP